MPKSIIPWLISIFLILISTQAFAVNPGTLKPTFEFIEVDGELVPFQSGVPLIDFELQNRPTIDLSGTWKKWRFNADNAYSFAERNNEGIANLEAEAADRHTVDFDDSGWDDHMLPGVESEMPGNEQSPPERYHDGVWYRQWVEVPADWEGSTNRFVCLGASYIADLWINGQWVGVHEGGYTPFAFEVSDYLSYGEENLFAIRIDKPFPGRRQDAVPSWFLMDWWSYTGIIQDFYVESAPALSIVRTNILPTSYNGHLDVKVVVQNNTAEDVNGAVTIEAFHADARSEDYLEDPNPASIAGSPAILEGGTIKPKNIGAGKVAVYSFSVHVKSPKRWTPKEPFLYVMKTTLTKDGEEMDLHHNQFGIRTVDREEGKMKVNGRVAFFPGVARHEEWPDTGRTATWDRIREDIEVMQDLHALFLRSGHYPSHVNTYLLTDRMGMATMAELPVYWFMGWNWNAQKIRGIAKQMFREMVFSNFNRPSIVLWGTNNEPFFLFYKGLWDFNERIADDHNIFYPSGRLVSQSLAAGNSWPIVANSQKPLDVAGWTLYYGVFYGKDYYDETMDFFSRHGEAYPDYPVVATEYGYWSGSDDGETDKQLEAFNKTWEAFVDAGALDAEGNVNPEGALAAASWWCVFNWFTKNGLPGFVAPYLQSMGLIHMDRATWKPAAYAMAEAYKPYYDFGGLGPEPDDYVDDDDTDDDDDSGDDDDENLPDDDTNHSDDDEYGPWPESEDDDNGCCG